MLTFELLAVDRLATSAVVCGEVAALEHELQRETTSDASILRGSKTSRRWFVTIGLGFSRMNGKWHYA